MDEQPTRASAPSGIRRNPRTPITRTFRQWKPRAVKGIMNWQAKSAAVAAALSLVLAVALTRLLSGLPGTEEIRDKLFTERAPKGSGTWLPLWAISPKLRQAVVTWEDPAFFHHSGLDYAEIFRAAWMDMKSGSYRRGASTITQQVAKNQFLSSEKTLSRKLREAILARRIEAALSKEEILTVYLNIAEWGDRIAGAEAASGRYFGKSASELNWAEAATLAGILPNPREWNPCRNPDRAQHARRSVLEKLLSMNEIPQNEFHEAMAAPKAECPDRVFTSPESVPALFPDMD